MTAHWLDSLRQDVVYAARSFRRVPGFTAGVILTLALGLGVNTAMFSFLDVVFLRPPAGVRDPEQVRRVWTEINLQSGPQFWSGFSYPQYAAIQSALGQRVATALYLSLSESRFGHAEAEIRVRLSYATASYFELLGVRPALGRFFTPEEDRLGAGAQVAVASHAFWRHHLGADAAVLGRELFIGGRAYTLIGVAAPGFTGVELDATDLWLPVASVPPRGPSPWWRSHIVNGLQILLRPRAGSGLADAALEERIALGLRTPEALMRPADSANAVRVGSIIRAQGPGNQEQEVKVATRLAGVTTVVLLIACANVINLLLARAVQRRREVAVRLAVGISRLRLARLLLTETVLLAMLAAGAAVVAAYWGGLLLRGLLLPDIRWAAAASPLHSRVVASTFGVGLVAGLVAGVLPAIQSARTQLIGALKAASGASAGQARRFGIRSMLVAAQAALSVTLLVGAGLFVSSLKNVRALRTGFDAERIIFGAVQFDTRDSVRDARQPQAFRELADRLRRAPGVEEVALARMVPTRGFSAMRFYPDVDTTQYPKPFATYNLVSPEFFAATGIRLLRGQDFPRASGSAMPPVVVVNQAMANAVWPGMDAVGRCLRFDPTARGQCYTVIGVVETTLFDRLLEEPQPQFYLPLDRPPAEAGSWFSSLVVRARPGAREGASGEVLRAMRETFPGGRPSVSTMAQDLEPQYRPWRLGATLFTAFGLLALVVVAVGMYSTVAYTVAQRTQEFGVRSALGADTPDILRHVIGGSLRTAAIGVAAGLALALAGGRFVAALLYGIAPSDPGVMTGVAAVLLLIATAAALGPAWRAARVDPVSALRAE